jgi:hypothetical protein
MGNWTRSNKLKRLNFAEIGPTTVQVSNCRLRVDKNLRQNLLHRPALTEVLCIYYICIVYYRKLIKCVWCP